MTKSNDIEAMLAGALPFRYQDAHLEIDAANKTIHLDSRPLKLLRNSSRSQAQSPGPQKIHRAAAPQAK